MARMMSKWSRKCPLQTEVVTKVILGQLVGSLKKNRISLQYGNKSERLNIGRVTMF